MLIKHLPVFIFSMYSVQLAAQINTRAVAKKDLPQTIINKYVFDTAVTWQDPEGVHYIIRSISDAKLNKRKGIRTAQLFAYHYLSADDSVRLLWKMQDGVIDCEVDFHAHFIPGSFSVTDLDKNNTPEIWLMYSQACRGDVSPPEMKIIMYEGQRKHAMRGRMINDFAEVEIGAGEYTFDAAFARAAPVKKKYAIQLWDKYKREKW